MVKFSSIHYNANVSNYQVSTTHKNERYILVVYKKRENLRIILTVFSKKRFEKQHNFYQIIADAYAWISLLRRWTKNRKTASQ